jgi:hypothetical protein
MEERASILAAQARWALGAGLVACSRGYLFSVEDNLFAPLSPETKAAFHRGSGGELEDKRRSPAKMRALHSSSALAVNVFDHWVQAPNTLLLRSLGLAGSSVASVRFEGQYPTGLPGTPPNLDVVIECPGTPVVAIESKFTEWLSPKRSRSAAFKDKYFPANHAVWSALGLERSQQLAAQLQARSLFQHLDAPQLLKHALGLAKNARAGFRLFYIYFDSPGSCGAIHRAEIAKFSEAVGSELGFQAISYQHLATRLIESKAGSQSYRDYLQRRYLHGAA